MTTIYAKPDLNGDAIERAVAAILNNTDREYDGRQDADGLTALVEAAKHYLACQSHRFIIEG